MWIVMTSCAKMPSSCWGRYRNVALVQLDQYYTAHGLEPAYISTHARGVLRVRHLGHFNDGKTARCAYARAVMRAQQMADDINNSPTVEAGDAILMSWGGSA